MKAIEPGYIYELLNGERLIFKGSRESGGHDGIENEELLEVILDRLHLLNQRKPCRENREAIIAIHRALGWLEQRAGKQQAFLAAARDPANR